MSKNRKQRREDRVRNGEIISDLEQRMAITAAGIQLLPGSKEGLPYSEGWHFRFPETWDQEKRKRFWDAFHDYKNFNPIKIRFFTSFLHIPPEYREEKTSHTPGPWEWHDDEGREAYSLRRKGRPEGIFCPTLSTSKEYMNVVFELKQYAKLLAISLNPYDSALLVAAPDLLEACKAALEKSESDEAVSGEESVLTKRLREAIALTEIIEPHKQKIRDMGGKA